MWDNLEKDLTTVKDVIDEAPKFKGHVDSGTSTCNDISIFKNPCLQLIQFFEDFIESKKKHIEENVQAHHDLNIPNSFRQTIERGPSMLD